MQLVWRFMILITFYELSFILMGVEKKAVKTNILQYLTEILPKCLSYPFLLNPFNGGTQIIFIYLLKLNHFLLKWYFKGGESLHRRLCSTLVKSDCPPCTNCLWRINKQSNFCSFVFHIWVGNDCHFYNE